MYFLKKTLHDFFFFNLKSDFEKEKEIEQFC